MTKHKFLGFILPQLIVAAAVSFFFLHLALSCYFSDSEIWLLTLSQKALAPFELTSIFYKYAFHILTYAFSHFAPSETDVYYYARFGWSLVGLASQVVLARVVSKSAGEKTLFLPVFICLMTSSMFFNQGFRVRGDVLSVFAHAGVLWFFYANRNATIRWYHYVALSGLNVILILSTPKAIYLVLAQVVFSSMMYSRLQLRRDFFLWIWASHVFPVAAGLGLALLTHLLPVSFDLTDPIHEAVDFYFKSYDNNLFNAEYLSILDFAHMIKFILHSPVHAMVLACGFAFYLKELQRPPSSPIFSCWNAYFGILLFFILVHNQKLPFFIGTYGAPLIAVASMRVFCWIKARKPTYFQRAVLVTVTAMTATCMLQYYNNLKFNNNIGQMLAIKNFDEYMKKNPDLRHYDVIGLLPRKNPIYLFVGPGEVSRKQQIIESIAEADPDLIIFTYKFIYLEPEIKDYLTEHRVPIEQNVWAKGEYYSVTRTNQYFKKSHELNGKHYWLLPGPGRTHVLDLLTHHDISHKVLFLDDSLKTTQRKQARYVAVPVEHMGVVMTDIAPIQFLQPPYFLFRFDTPF